MQRVVLDNKEIYIENGDLVIRVKPEINLHNSGENFGLKYDMPVLKEDNDKLI